MLQVDIITLFPQFFSAPLETSIVGKAIANQKITVRVHDLRPYGLGKHQITDDRPFGGGPGMVMLIEPLHNLLKDLHYEKGTPSELIALTSAKGSLYTQQIARKWAKLERLCLICGHYEGVDERVADHLIDTEIRIGDYVLTGGEPASLVIVDSVARLQPDVLGNEDSLVDESHDTPGKMSYPQYSRPEIYQGWKVPSILLSGNHPKVAEWRNEESRQASERQKT